MRPRGTMSLVPRTMQNITFSFGPRTITPAVKWLLIANVAVFLLQQIISELLAFFGLTPQLVWERFFFWQLATYLFLHIGISHLLFNMLSLWMFGVELEQRWGTYAFLRYYFVCGVGAGICSVLGWLLPFELADRLYFTTTVGASGAVYGLLLAYGVLFRDRMLFLFIFPVKAWVYVWIAGAFILYLNIFDAGGGTAHLAHLGGMLFGYLYLTWRPGGPMAEIKYRLTKWRMARLRKRFGVHTGGRGWNERVH